jgi:hypothetical protein
MLDNLGSNEIRLILSAQDDATSKLAGLTAALGPLGIAAGLVVGAFAAVGAAITVCAKAALDWGDSLHDIQMVMNDTTDQAAGLKLATDATGVSIDLITNKMILLAKGLELSGDKAGNSAKELDKLGIAYRNADGTLMDSTQLLQSIADHFGNMANGTEKNNELTNIFGRNVAGLNEFLTQIANQGMSKFIDQAKAMGLAMDDKAVQAAHDFNESLRVLHDALTGIEVTLGQAFIPALQEVVNWFEQVASSIEPAIKQFGQFLAMLLGVPAAATAAAAASSKMASAVPSDWKYAGTVSGPGSAPVYTSGSGDMLTYHVGAGGSTAGGLQPPNESGSPGGLRRGEMTPTINLTPFEEALMGFKDALVKEWPVFEQSLKDFWTNINKVDWASIATQLVQFGTDMINFMNSPTMKFLSQGFGQMGQHQNETYSAIGDIQSGQKGGWIELLRAALGIPKGGIPSLGIGGLGAVGGATDKGELDFSKMDDNNKPLPIAVATTLNTNLLLGIQASNKDTTNLYITQTKDSNVQLTSHIAAQNTTLLGMNTLLANLPSLIRSAVLQGK